jgi:ankyrin repeat protein
MLRLDVRDTQGRYFGNALQAASNSGYDQAVTLLLGKGANVKARGRECGNALNTTSSRGHEQVVKLLLDSAGVPEEG